MAGLFTRPPKDSFHELLKINSSTPGTGLGTELQSIEDGMGVQTPIQLSTTQIAFHGKVWPTANQTAGAVLRIGDNNQLEWADAGSKSMQNVNSYFPGILKPLVGTVRWYAGKDITLKSVFAFVSGAPSSALVFDIKKNGLSIYGSNQKPSIGASSYFMAASTIEVAMLASDYLTIDILEGDGSDMTVRIEYQ